MTLELFEDPACDDETDQSTDSCRAKIGVAIHTLRTNAPDQYDDQECEALHHPGVHQGRSTHSTRTLHNLKSEK